MQEKKIKKKKKKTSLFKTAPAKYDRFAALKKKLWTGSAVGIAVSLITLGFISRHATPDFVFLAGALMALCGLVLYDIMSRKLWTQDFTEEVQMLARNHDRLIREVARNRSDIVATKEGFADMTLAVKDKGRVLTPSNSAEARMLDTMVDHMEKIGDKPQTLIADIEKAPENQSVLSLTMAPPPQQRPPETKLTRALSKNSKQNDPAKILGFISQAAEKDLIDVYAQPVVTLPQRKIHMIEFFARIKNSSGDSLPAAQYAELAAQENMLASIDNLLLMRCLEMLRDRKTKDSTVPYILNVTADTLNDSAFMNALVSFLSRNRKMADRLVFELKQAEIMTMDKSESGAKVMNGLAQLGCHFSMDSINNRKLNAHFLKSRHIRFIKMDAAWLLREATSEGGISRVNRLKTLLNSVGIDLIIERVETEDQLRELLDFNIDYGQGYLFGKPDYYHGYHEKIISSDSKVA